MKHIIAHDLDIATARKVTDRAFAEYKARYGQYNPELRWANENRAEVSFQAMGVKLEGAMEVGPKDIALDLDVPFLLRPFRSKAIEVIEREVKLWIGKAKAGEI